MDVKLIYSKPQLEAAVNFIAKHNQHFLGQKDYIRSSILEDMRRVASDPEQWMSGTMGYLLMGDRTDEGIDSDDNSIHFDISVDPALGYDTQSEDYVEEIVS